MSYIYRIQNRNSQCIVEGNKQLSKLIFFVRTLGECKEKLKNVGRHAKTLVCKPHTSKVVVGSSCLCISTVNWYARYGNIYRTKDGEKKTASGASDVLGDRPFSQRVLLTFEEEKKLPYKTHHNNTLLHQFFFCQI